MDTVASTPATIFDIFDIDANTDGYSLLPALKGEPIGRPNYLYFENYERGEAENFVWKSILEQKELSKWIYTQWQDGETELYDLIQDPYQEENISQSVGVAAIEATLSEQLSYFPNIAITTRAIPSGIQNTAYAHQLTAVWGTDGISQVTTKWAVIDGDLPTGIILDENTGSLSGIPIDTGTFEIVLRVERAEISEFTGNPIGHSAEFSMSIEEPALL
jgi:hypothetical protein